MNYTKNKTRFLVLACLALSITSCGGGGSGGSGVASTNNGGGSGGGGGTVPVTTFTVPSAGQLATPLSSFARVPLANVNSCFALQDMGNGKNYSLAINSSAWWSTVDLSYTIKNTCATGQSGNITANLNGFNVNGSSATSLAAYVANTGSPYMTSTVSGNNGNFVVNMNTPSCSGDWCSWAQIPAGGSKTFTVEYSLSSAVTAATLASITLGGTPPPPPPPVESGSIQVSLDGTSLASICNQVAKCNLVVSYSSSGLAKQSFNYDPYVNPKQIVNINNLNTGNYQFSVTGQPANVTTLYNPISVTVTGGNTSNESINFVYNPPVTTGNLLVTLNKISNSSDYNYLASAKNMLLQLVDETNNTFSQNCNINMGSSCTFNNLPVSDKYHVAVQGVGDALDGVYYNSPNIPVAVVANQTTNKAVDYVKVTTGLLPTAFAVNGLESGATAQVQFTDSNSTYQYVSNQLSNTNYKFLSGQTVAVNPSNVSGYAKPIVTPQVFSAGAQSVAVTYTKVSSAGTFDFIAPFKDYNNIVNLSVQGVTSGNKVTIVTNFNPASGWGTCFGGQYPTINTAQKPDGTYVSDLVGSAPFNFNQQSCSIFGTNSGNALVLPGVTDPVVYSVTVDGMPLGHYSPCAGTSCKDPLNGHVGSGYYAEWTVWGRQYNPYNMPFNNMNHIIYAFIGFDGASGNIKTLDASADSWGLSATTRAMIQYPYMHASLSFGGWTNGCDSCYTAPMFEALVSNSASVNNFVSQAVSLMRTTGLDGIDIDWEWWSGSTGSAPNNTAPAKGNLVLLSALRTALDNASKQDGKHYYLTIAVNGGNDRILAMQDTANNPNAVSNYWAQVAGLVDRINIMNYDYHGSFATNTPAYFQANFNFANVNPSVDVGQSTGWSIQDSVNTYIANGLSAKQIVVGIPLYARTMTVSSNTNGGLFQSITGAGFGDYQVGILDYKCLVNPVFDPVNGCGSTSPLAGLQSTTFYNSKATGSNLDLYNQYGSGAMQPWGYSSSTNSFISYDDTVTAVAKANYTKTNNLAGVMYWELDGDSTNPGTSILQAVQGELSK